MHIPSDVRRFLEVTLGLSWPESDDRGLTALRRAWAEFEAAVTIYEDAVGEAGVAAAEALTGETGEFFGEYLTALVPKGLDGLAEASGELARMAQNAAADVYKTKVMFVVFAAFTLASVLHLLATLIFAALAGVVITTARVALAAIWRALVERLSNLTVAAVVHGARKAATQAAAFAGFGAALMGGTDFGVQARQIADGDRDGWDTRSLTSSFAGGALGGAFAGLFHAGAGLIRGTALTLRDRLDVRPGLLDELVPGSAVKGVTAGQVGDAITGPLAAMGNLAYGLGQVQTTLTFAVPINLALGAPAGNPLLGILGSLSTHGGGHRSPTPPSLGTPALTLDALLPPPPPTLTIHGDKAAIDATGSAPAKAEALPPYSAALAGQAAPQEEKSPAYTTSPQAIGALYAAPAYASVAGSSPGSATGDTTPTVGAVTTVSGAVPGDSTGRAEVTGVVSAPEGRSVQPLAVAEVSTPTTWLAPVAVPAGTVPAGDPAMAVGAATSPPGEPVASSGSQASPHARASQATLAVSTVASGETRSDSAVPARNAGQDVSSSRPHGAGAVTAQGTSVPPVTAAGSPPRLAHGEIETVSATTHGPPSSVVPFLTGTAPETATTAPVVHAAATPGTPAVPAPWAGIPVVFPTGPLQTVPLPNGGGVAFVSHEYAPNVLNAFPQPRPGVLRIVNHHAGEHYFLPGDHGRPLAHRSRQFTEALANLPTALAPWRTVDTLELWACNLTPRDRTRLARHLRGHPALHHLTLTFAHAGTPVHITPRGRVSTAATSIGLPPGTLTLAPKGKGPAKPAVHLDDPEWRSALATKLIHQHGDVEIKNLLTHLTKEGIQSKDTKVFRADFQAQREAMKKRGELWQPLYRGEPRLGKFSPENPDALTVWLYWQAADQPNVTAGALARYAREAGFARSADLLYTFAQQALMAAEADGRRNRFLSISKVGDLPEIRGLIDALIVTNSSLTATALVKLARNEHGIRGDKDDFKKFIDARLRQPDHTLDVATARARLAGRLNPKFLGRSLDVDAPGDRVLIGQWTYAVAWTDKDATPDEIADRLAGAGVAGSRELLGRLVTEMVAEAARNGDRLELLSAGNPGHADAIQARTAAILLATPGLRHADRLNELVNHMRMRHITGLQDDLKNIAVSARQVPSDTLRTITANHPDLLFGPISYRERHLDLTIDGDRDSLRELARNVVAERGMLSDETLIRHLIHEGVLEKPGLGALIRDAKAQARTEGSAWHPTYHGQVRQGPADLDSPDHLAAVLWLLAVGHPQEDPAQIARRAEQAGFTDLRELVKSAESVMVIAEENRRRPPFLSLSKPEHLDDAHAVIDALLVTEPDLDLVLMTARLRDHNIQGQTNQISNAAKTRRQAIAAAEEQNPEVRQARVDAAMAVLNPQPVRRFLNFSLDAGRPNDLETIGRLAYAVAWADKSADPAALIVRLGEEGVTGDHAVLTAVVTSAIAEADRHGDRLPELTTDLAVNTPDIQQRSGRIILGDAARYLAGGADPVNELVRQMRVHHITGPAPALRAHAETLLAIRAEQPLHGSASVPLTSFGQPVWAVPFPGGIGFVADGYSPNLLNAFPTPLPGTLRIIAPRAHDTGSFLVPGPHGTTIPHNPGQLLSLIGDLPADLATRLALLAPVTNLELWTCHLTPQDQTNLAQLIRSHPTLHHLTVTFAHPGGPIHITPAGRLSTAATSAGLPPGTLTLGPEHYGEAPAHTHLSHLGVLPTAPPGTVAEIRDLLELLTMSAAVDGRRPFHPLLGPDLFGFGRTPDVLDALSGLDHDELSAAQGVTLLTRLDLTRPFPDAEALTPEALAEGSAKIHVSAWTRADRQFWEREGLDPETLPARRETPELLHGIWLGCPLADGGETGLFKQGFAVSARKLAGRAVLWTDVPRSRFEAARANPLSEEFAGEREMARWALTNDIILVNVDEVFNAESPMTLDPFYRAELTKGTTRGYVEAADSLRVEILARFGGLYLDGDDKVLDPRILQHVHAQPKGFAVTARQRVSLSGEMTTSNSNSGLATAKGHHMAWVYLCELAASYERAQVDVFPTDFAARPKEWFASPLGLPRRNSVMWRTGPQLFPKLRARLGDFPPLTGSEPTSRASWVPGVGVEVQRPRIAAADLEGTTLLAAKAVQTLVRELANRQGDLRLIEILDLVHQHETPEIVWSAALGYLADTPRLRERVRTVTINRYFGHGFVTVSLPPEVRDLLAPRAGKPVEYLGETIIPVTLRAPAPRRARSIDVDWPAPFPPLDLAEAVLAIHADFMASLSEDGQLPGSSRKNA
ncbi:hypothetical protein DMC64_20375 [Amycolatopsis sp. WAC 04197]|uniref:WXG100-like domain-containing protein n=1 Tax=Amycolatopsis sp. WAC 04197 TaxID=2203199 RepID=UPI000F79CD34|nr:hypothetical protein [Amycolatopsis sp. WAC 04197]RSN45196.1 hypothetical protein DMC64_20375 [Amycolatopsis sp. WAC 04197]